MKSRSVHVTAKPAASMCRKIASRFSTDRRPVLKYDTDRPGGCRPMPAPAPNPSTCQLRPLDALIGKMSAPSARRTMTRPPSPATHRHSHAGCIETVRVEPSTSSMQAVEQLDRPNRPPATFAPPCQYTRAQIARSSLRRRVPIGSYGASAQGQVSRVAAGMIDCPNPSGHGSTLVTTAMVWCRAGTNAR